MARPRKTLPSSDLFADLSKKTEILEREMRAQQEAIERLKQLSKVGPQPVRAEDGARAQARRRASR